MIQQLALLFLLSCHSPALPADTLLGHLVGRSQVRGQFFTFDKTHDDRFVFSQGATRIILSYGAPEMACFIANHEKDDLRLNYSTYVRSDSAGASERYYVADRIVSLKTGDDTDSWAKKDVADSAAHHLTLQKLRKTMLGRN